MKERVLHVIANLDLGGAQSVLYHLWPSLQRSGRYQFELCVLNRLGQFGEKLIFEGAKIHCLTSRGKYDPGVVSKLRELILQQGYRIVHAHLFPELAIVPIAAAGMSDVRLVYTEHSADNRRRKFGCAARMFDRLLYNPYARVVAVNCSAHQNLTSWLPELAARSVMIPNSIRLNRDDDVANDLRAQLRIRRGESVKLILFAGRLSRVKGADVLISALSHLKRNDLLCLIAGDGPDRERLEEQVSSLNLRERVRFLGARRDVRSLLSQVDFLVLPSRCEGLPLIVLEAMAAGCPVVATSVDGTAEVLRNEESALLVPPNDSRAMAAAIKRFLDEPSLRHTLASRGRVDVESYSSDVIAKQLLSLYDQVLNS